MLTVFAAPVLLFLLALPVLLPYRSFRLALHNSRRPDGSRSPSRARREARHAVRFVRTYIVFPILAFAALGLCLFLFHRYVVPDTTLHHLFGNNHPETSLHAPDLEAWYEAIDEARRESRDLVRQESPWVPKQRLREIILTHWPLHLIFMTVPPALLVWFLVRHYYRAARAYHLGVTKRHERYRLRGALR
ncbi:MAG: hypothetical protein AAGI91_14455 [Bacteroidota bacterium]